MSRSPAPGEHRPSTGAGDDGSDEAGPFQLSPEAVGEPPADELVGVRTATAVAGVQLQGQAVRRGLGPGCWDERQEAQQSSNED